MEMHWEGTAGTQPKAKAKGSANTKKAGPAPARGELGHVYRGHFLTEVGIWPHGIMSKNKRQAGKHGSNNAHSQLWMTNGKSSGISTNRPQKQLVKSQSDVAACGTEGTQQQINSKW